MLEGITWFDHASFMLQGERRVYIDPWELPEGAPPADIVLVSHPHYDHCSPADLARVAGLDTVVVTTADAAPQLEGYQQVILAPGAEATVKGVRIEGVAAYNLNKPFHPEDKRWLGFVVTLGGRRIYYAGDTDATEEMAGVRADVALVPVGGKYTMEAEQAAAAVDEIRPAVAVPYHWGKIVGSKDSALLFETLCRVRVAVLGKASRR